MSKTGVFIAGLAAGIGLVSGYLMLIREKPKPQRLESDLTRKELDAARESLKKMAQRLAESEERNSRPAARMPETERQPVPPPTPEAAPKSDKLPDMRRLARSMVKLIKIEKERQNKGERWEDLPPEAMEEMIAMQADLMKFMAAAKIKMYDPYSAFANPESRQMIVDFASMVLEEAGVVVDKAKLDALLARMGEGSAIHNDKNLTDLEKAVKEKQLEISWLPDVDRLFTADQREKVRQELGGDFGGGLLGFGEGRFVGGGPSHDATDRPTAAENVMSGWSRELKLNDSEKPLVRFSADRYVQDYVMLKKGVETEYGKEFMDVYLRRGNPYQKAVAGDTRRPEDQEKEFTEYERKRQEYTSRPDYKVKSASADLKFLELQLKYQGELKVLLGPEKSKPIQKMPAHIRHFPNLE